MHAQIRARATCHDLSSATPDKKKGIDKKEKKGKNKRLDVCELRKRKRNTFSNAPTLLLAEFVLGVVNVCT